MQVSEYAVGQKIILGVDLTVVVVGIDPCPPNPAIYNRWRVLVQKWDEGQGKKVGQPIALEKLCPKTND